MSGVKQVEMQIPIFLEMIDNFNDKNVDERTQPVKLNTKINDILLLKCVDDLSKEYLTSLNSPAYCDINVYSYSAAITCLRAKIANQNYPDD